MCVYFCVIYLYWLIYLYLYLCHTHLLSISIYPFSSSLYLSNLSSIYICWLISIFISNSLTHTSIFYIFLLIYPSTSLYLFVYLSILYALTDSCEPGTVRNTIGTEKKAPALKRHPGSHLTVLRGKLSLFTYCFPQLLMQSDPSDPFTEKPFLTCFSLQRMSWWSSSWIQWQLSHFIKMCSSHLLSVLPIFPGTKEALDTCQVLTVHFGSTLTVHSPDWAWPQQEIII